MTRPDLREREPSTAKEKEGFDGMEGGSGMLGDAFHSRLWLGRVRRITIEGGAHRGRGRLRSSGGLRAAA